MKVINLKDKTTLHDQIKYIVIDHYTALNSYDAFIAFDEAGKDGLITDYTKLIIKL